MKKEEIEEIIKNGPLKFDEVVFISTVKRINAENAPLYYFNSLFGICKIVEFQKNCIRF